MNEKDINYQRMKLRRALEAIAKALEFQAQFCEWDEE